MTNTADAVKSVYAGLASGDIGALLGALDPAIERTEAEGFPYGGTYVGRATVQAALRWWNAALTGSEPRRSVE